MQQRSLTKLSLALILAMGALNANAFKYGDYDTQVDGLISDNRMKFVGANYINNGPLDESEALIGMYGDHNAMNDYKADTQGDVSFNLSQSVLERHPSFVKVYGYGAGLVYGSVDTSNEINSAKVNGNVALNIHDIGSASQIYNLDASFWGGGGIETYTGDASVNGDVTVTISNVYAAEFEINGGGRADGGNPPTATYDRPNANISGKVVINIKNAELGVQGAVYGAGDAAGEGSTANVGSVEINADRLTFDAPFYDEEEGDYIEAENIVMGGGLAFDQSFADVNGDVKITLKNSSIQTVMGGGSTENDLEDGELDGRDRYNGQSAAVKGHVEINLENTKADEVIASGNTNGAAWGDKYEIIGELGDASVGSATITLSGQTSVGNVYLAGSGEGSNVNGDSTLVIEGNDVEVGHIYGAAFGSEVEGTAKIAFGSDFNRTFDTPYEAIDELEALNGSNVAITITDTEAAQGLTLSGAGNFNADIRLTSGTLTVNGKVNATALSLTGNGGLVMAQNGVLTTTTDQLFTNALNAEGTNKDAGALNENGQHIDFVAGSIAFNDEFYNEFYSNSAAGLVGSNTTLVFNGTPVDVEGDMDLDDVVDSDNTIHSNVDVAIGNESESVVNGVATIDKSFGVSSINVAEGVNEVAISQSNTVTLVGGDDKELIAFAGEGDKSVTVEGTLKLGDAASTNNSGKLSAPVTITNSGEMNVQAGSYQIADLTVNSSSLVVNNASASIDTLKLNTSSTITSGSQAVEVKGMTVDATAHTVTGAVNVEKLTAAAGSVINVGTEDARGDMTVGETSELNGMTFFLDPAWVEGQEVTDASRLVFKNPKVDAKVIAGHNSYVVFGSGNTTNFTPVFGKQVTWGQGGVLAAAYVAQPITIDANGALVVDGSLQQLGDAPAAGSVTFGENSVLVADVTELASGEALITADTFNVNDASKAVIVGSMKNGETYKLASVDNVWSADQIVSGNALWSLTGNDDGSFTVKLEDATKIFGDLMQGGQLANAGMTAGGDAGNYVDSLLTDASGNVGNLASTAARFDAAMNIGGALSVFTNAYDRAGEFRKIVRSESTMDQEPRLWAHVMGGKTKLKGISSGAQSIHTETDHYGIVIGAEGMVTNNLSLGVALAAGTGDTDNDKVNAKDEFDYYGISAYGRTTVGFVDILGDVSATFLKSDMKMHGVADIDADTDTAVYSAGIQAQKTLNLGWADVTPFIGMDVYHVRSDGYSAGHGIKVEDSDATAVEFPIGAKLAKSFETAGGMTVAPTFSLAVVPTVADRDIDSKVKFAGATGQYNFTFADDVQVRSQLGVQAAKDNFRFGLNAGYDWGNEERSDLSVQARLKYLF